MTPDSVLQALQGVVDPLTGQDFVSTRRVLRVEPRGDELRLEVAVPYPARSLWPQWQEAMARALAPVGVQRLQVDFRTEVAAHAVQRGLQPLPGVKNIVAIASGKGGVGKSTTTVNLALALAAEGARVGVLDADIYGPSVPTMLGLSGRPASDDGKTMEPLERHGLQAMSIGLLVDPDSPMIWRGPMATQALDQLLRQTRWHDLDYLLVDMPPGTGDIALSLSQRVPLTGAVIVTTPQDIALLDARKGLRMFEKVHVPILGLVENMAVYHCPQCGHEEHLFGQGGAQRMSEQYGCAVLGALPLELGIRVQTDAGTPTVVSAPASPAAQAYVAIAHALGARIAVLAKDYSSRFPTITVSSQT
jgi:ATP-binding protein involved in chromosome partitioning